MANERIVSPGVFTRERDLSFLTQGISEIGGAFIGPTPKGPAFIPTIVRSQQEYVTQFGEADANHYTGLTVKNYLRESGVATVVRVLGTEGYGSASAASVAVYASVTDSGSTSRRLFAVLHPTSKGDYLTGATATGFGNSFNLIVSGANNQTLSVTGLSADAGSPSYLGDYFGNVPTANSTNAKIGYTYTIFPSAISELVPSATLSAASMSAALASVTMSAGVSASALQFDGVSYSNAHTPWIQSQTIAGERIDLFKLNTLGDGSSANKEIKVSFLNMKASDDPDYGYGTFSMLIRRYDDTDARIEVLEQYDNLTLDADSPQFIARVIGNSAPYDDPNTLERYYQGDFPNRSQYVYVEMTDGVIPVTALPFGFAPYETPVSITLSGITASDVPEPDYVLNRWSLNGALSAYTTASIDKKLYYGWDFNPTADTNISYLNATPLLAVSTNTEFNLEDVGEEVQKAAFPYSASISLTDSDSLTYRKFSVAFQGGFNGMNPARDVKMGEDISAINSQAFDLSTSTAAGAKAYKKALQALSNQDQWDFNLLVLPGVIYELHSYVADTALSLCEDRGDCFYIMDTVGLNATLATATGKAAEIDSNYAATYYPWLRVIDTNTNKLLWVPPSVILPEIYAYNDNVAAEWFAPAGLNRGGIASAVGVKVRLPQSSRDTLYEGKVNPIAQFPGQGICVWGQKTLQRRASALDRVNVRRLLIAVKKYIASVSRYLVFEQNVEATRNRFLNIVNPYLASVQERSGLYAFRVIMDETNNTPDIIDRNILYGQLYLQPTRTAEFIILDFNVLPTGATFPTA